MLAWGSELRFRRRRTSLILDLTSLNSALSSPSSTEAVRIRPSRREMSVCRIMLVVGGCAGAGGVSSAKIIYGWENKMRLVNMERLGFEL